MQLLKQKIATVPFVGLIVSLVCLFGIISLQQSTIQSKSSQLSLADYLEQEKQEKLDLNLWGKLPSLGFNNLIADWLYLRFIQYFGDGDAREKTGYMLSSSYFEQVVDRDPLFVDAMIKLDTSTSLFEGNPQLSVRLLTKSVNSIPPDMFSPGTPAYYLWLYKGIDQLLFLGQPQAAKRSYQVALNLMKETKPQTEKTQGLIARTQQTIDFLDRNPKSRAAQIGAWAGLLGNIVDKKTLQQVIQEIQSLGGEIITSPDGRLLVRVPPNIE
jgi:hypothetical protein